MDLAENSAKLDQSGIKKSIKNGMMKKWFWRFVIAVAVIVAGYYFVPQIKYFLSHESTDNAYVTGRITPISAEVKGRVVKVFVADNQLVKAGDPLFEIFAEDYVNLKTVKEESRASLLAQKVEIASSLEEKKKALEQVRANFQAAVVEEERAAQELERYRGLLKEELVAKSKYDDVESRWKVAQALRDASRAAVAGAEAALETLAARLKTQDFMINEADASLGLAKLDVKRTKMTAPISGRVAKKDLEPGEYVQAGQPLLAIIDDKDIWIVANYKETQIRKMRVGQAVDIKVDSYPGIKFTGHIDSFQSGTGSVFSLLPPENATGSFVKVVQRIPVKIVLDSPPDPEHPLWPGMSVTPYATR